MTDTVAPLVFHCPWGSTGVVGTDQRVHPRPCAEETWESGAELVDHLLSEHGGIRGWQRPAALREVEAQRQAWIDAQAPEPTEADADCGAVHVFAGFEYVCDLKVHAGNHRYTTPDGGVTITWEPAE